jgi:hypothetical protein
MTRIDWLALARAKIANISPQPAVNTVVRNPTTVTTVSRALGFSEKTVRARSNDSIDGTAQRWQAYRAAKAQTRSTDSGTTAASEEQGLTAGQ